MAGDWIKMRKGLYTHPKVVRISSALKADRLRTVGALHVVWSLFDEHSEDGSLDGYTPESLDSLIVWPGFSEALAAVGWLEVNPESLALPRFDDHNGNSAKRRAQEADRKRDARKTSAPDADKKRTREEKRREENKDQKHSSFPNGNNPSTPPVGLNDFSKAERLVEVTTDACNAFNARLGAPNGLLAAVSMTVGKEKRQGQVKRCLRVVREICLEQYGDTKIIPKFWEDYFAECARDDFKSGRQLGGKGHENWKPTFEYLTREAVVLEVFDKANSEQAA